MRRWKKSTEVDIQRGKIITNYVHWGPHAIMYDWHNWRPGCSNFWHSGRLPKRWLRQRWHTHQDGGVYIDSTQGDQPRLIQGPRKYIAAEKVYVLRSQECYIRCPRGSITILDKIIQGPIKMGYKRNGYDWCEMKKKLKVNSARYSGILMIWIFRMLIPSLSL